MSCDNFSKTMSTPNKTHFWFVSTFYSLLFLSSKQAFKNSLVTITNLPIFSYSIYMFLGNPSSFLNSNLFFLTYFFCLWLKSIVWFDLVLGNAWWCSGLTYESMLRDHICRLGGREHLGCQRSNGSSTCKAKHHPHYSMALISLLF